MSIKIPELVEAILDKKKNHNISSTTIARLTGISKSSISRLLIHGKGIDMESLGRLCRWLDLPISTFTAEGELLIAPGETTLEKIQYIVNSDQKLDVESKRSLMELFIFSWNKFT